MKSAKGIRAGLAVVLVSALLSPALAAEGSGEAAQKTKIAVLSMKCERGMDESLVGILNELLLTEFEKTGKYEVISDTDLNSILRLEQKKRLLDCTDITCLSEIGGALGVEKMVSASIGRVGDYYLINMKLINVRGIKVEKRINRKVEGEENELIGAMEASVRDLATGVAGEVSAWKKEAPTHPYALWGHVTFWSGVGCAGVGVLALFLAKDAGDEFDYAGDPADLDKSKTWSGVMWTGFSLGAALMATGITLWLLEPTEAGLPESTAASVVPAPDGQGMVFTIVGRW
jgi:hypothetical protein